MIEGLVSELVRRGYRISVVKHSVHTSTFDEPGKDTWRFVQAGAKSVALFSAHELVTIRRLKEEPSLDAVVKLLGEDSDLILVEGYRKGKEPAIEVLGLTDDHEDAHELIAVVCERQRKLGIPTFGFDEVTKLADLIENMFLKSMQAP